MLQRLKHISIDAGAPLIGVISNPRSTRNRDAIGRVRRYVERHPHLFHYELDSIDSIPAALEMFADAHVAVLLVNGGDGTIQAVLSSILRHNPFEQTPPIAILPGGKTNMIAQDLGSRGNPEQILSRLQKLVKAGKLEKHTVNRNLIEMDLGDGRSPRVGMFFGAAGMVNGILWVRRKIYPLEMPNALAHLLAFFGLVWSALGLSRNSVLESEPMQIHVVDGGRFEGRYLVVVATTLERLVLGLRPFNRDARDGIKFTAIEEGTRALWGAVMAQLTRTFGRRFRKGVHVRCSRVIRVSGSNPFTLDGEIFYPDKGSIIELRGDKRLPFIRF